MTSFGPVKEFSLEGSGFRPLWPSRARICGWRSRVGRGRFRPFCSGSCLCSSSAFSAAPGDASLRSRPWPSSTAALCGGSDFFPALSFRGGERSRPRPCCFLPLPVQGLWLGKTLAGLALLLLCQIFFRRPPSFLALIRAAACTVCCSWSLASTLGRCILGGLIGAMGHGHGAKDALLTIIVFPLWIPLQGRHPHRGRAHAGRGAGRSRRLVRACFWRLTQFLRARHFSVSPCFS